MLTASVDAFERLFMEQARETMAVSYLLHHLHDELVVVNGNIDGLKYRSKFMLSRCNLVVLSLCRDAEFPELFVQVLHKRFDSRFDGTEVVVIHFLSLRSRSTK